MFKIVEQAEVFGGGGGTNKERVVAKESKSERGMKVVSVSVLNLEISI